MLSSAIVWDHEADKDTCFDKEAGDTCTWESWKDSLSFQTIVSLFIMAGGLVGWQIRQSCDANH